MFEKEAEEWADKMYPCDGQAQRYLLMGVEFGYNKANEWHYVKDGDLPKHENYVLVSNGKDWTKAFYKNGKWNVISLVGFLHVIAWKEIELPKEIKEMTKYRVKRPKDTVEVLILPNKDGSGYQYINITKGHICPCKFKTEIDALRDMDKKVSEGKVLSYEEIEDSEMKG